MEARKKRTKNFNSDEDRLLLNIVVKYLDVIRNKQSNTRIRQEKKEAWDGITHEFNSASMDEARVADDLKTRWRNIRKTVFAGGIEADQVRTCAVEEDSSDGTPNVTANLELHYDTDTMPCKKICLDSVDEQSSTHSYYAPRTAPYDDNEYLELMKKDLREKSVQRQNREKRESEEFHRRKMCDLAEERRRTEKHELEMSILRATLNKFTGD